MDMPESNVMAIDPMAIILRGNALWLWYLMQNPNVPPVGDVRKALNSLSAEEKQIIIKRAKMLSQYAAVVEEALRT